MCNACKCGGSNLSGGRAAPRVLRVWHTSQSINGPQSSVLVQTRNWASCNFTTSHICACVWVHVCVRQSKSWNNGRQTTIVNQFSSPFDSFHFFALLSQISLSYCIFLFSSPLASLSHFILAHATVSHFFLALDGFSRSTASTLFWKCPKASVTQSKACMFIAG